MIDQYSKDIVKTKRILRRILIVIIALLMLFIIVKLLRDVGGIILFRVKKVQIFGSNFLNNKGIMKTMGLGPSISLLTFNRKKAETLLMSDMRVESAVVVKAYPDMIKVYIKEKNPEYILYAGQKVYAVSMDGVVLGEINKRSEKYGPILQFENSDDIKIGKRLNNFLGLNVLETLNSLKREGKLILERISSVEIRSSGIYLQIDGGRYMVYAGNSVSEDTFNRLDALIGVLKERYRTNTDSKYYVDLSFSQAAVKIQE